MRPSPTHSWSLAFAIALAAMSASCRDDTPLSPGPRVPPGPVCEDGIREGDEICDGEDLGRESCASQGFEGGTLTCGADCRLDTSGCTRRCGNGQLDPGEACDGVLGPLTCDTFGFKSCSATCTLESRTCVSVALDRGTDVVLTPGGPAILTRLPPTGVGALVAAVPDLGRLTVRRHVRDRGLVENGAIERPGRTPIDVLAIDPDGDGIPVLATLDADGALDLLTWRNATDGFIHTSRPREGGDCAPARFLGLLTGVPASGPLIVATACPEPGDPLRAGALLAYPADASGRPAQALVPDLVAAVFADLDGTAGPAVRYLQSGNATLGMLVPTADGWTPGPPLALPVTGTALAAADFDGDGRIDLAVAGASSVEILHNQGGTLVRGRSLPGAATQLQAVDLDGDGRVDLVWLEAGVLRVARNQGAGSFTVTGHPAGAGLPLSLAVGDVDGDGDLDLAATFAAGADSTRSAIFFNRVR